MAVRWLPLSILLASGCLYQELTSSHVEPGGTVTAMLDGGMPRTTTGLGDATKDPFSLSGFSPFLTFGLVAPGSKMALSMDNTTVEVDLAPGSGVQLEIHSDGTGCSAQSGVVHLHTSGDGHVDGDFTATGLVPGTTTACSFAGTLAGIPLSR